ncbi:hypothetical protein [Rhizobium sp. RU35A]|nr:hypothetical protein [Rhizobium sp. RU35A]
MSAPSLTHELDLLKRQFQPFTKTGLSLNGGEVKRLTGRLNLLIRLSRSLETELSIHRLAEDGRAQADALEQVTTDIAGDLILAAEGNVVRPDFTKGSRK